MAKRGGAHKHKACEGKGCEGCKGTGIAPTGPKKKEQPAVVGDKQFAAKVLSRIGELGLVDHQKKPIRNDEDYALWLLGRSDTGPSQFEKLREKRDGKAVHTVNHLHDKPIEHNVTISIAETIQKARKRAGK